METYKFEELNKDQIFIKELVEKEAKRKYKIVDIFDFYMLPKWVTGNKALVPMDAHEYKENQKIYDFMIDNNIMTIEYDGMKRELTIEYDGSYVEE